MSMNQLSEDTRLALRTIGAKLTRCEADWLVGGSCGLLLRGVALAAAPRDLDIYVDEEQAEAFYEAMSAYATDVPAHSETPIYRSFLSHYALAGTAVELVGGFRVANAGCVYQVRVRDTLLPYAPSVKIDGTPIRLMPLAHELIFNYLRGREDRYEAIAAVMKLDLASHLPALRRIFQENRFSPEAIVQLELLLNPTR